MVSTTTDRLAGVTAGLASKSPVRAATTANITLSGEQTVDGIAVVADDRVLVKNQTDGIENGVYDAKSGAWVRSLDFDGTRDIKSGTFVVVASGTAGAGTLWRVSTADDITIGTTSIAFALMTVDSASAFMITVLDDADSAAALATLVAAGTAIINTFTKVQTFSAAPVHAKGTDTASASPLVLLTDGIWFDVTGTTGFSSITVAAGTWFMLQFDGILTMTDGAALDLGGVDITTAAGDRGLFFAIAANTSVLMAYFEEGGRMPGPDFESSETALNDDAQLTFAHGLGTVPRKVEVVLRANTATAQGWADNEEMILCGGRAGTTTVKGVDFTADATNVYITQAASIEMLDHTSFALEDITDSEYDWVVRAWR